MDLITTFATAAALVAQDPNAADNQVKRDEAAVTAWANSPAIPVSGEAQGLSIGPIAFSCAGIAGPVLATFFNNSPSVVALEWDGQAMNIAQTLSGSGARYEGRWKGQQLVFWNKGNEATFTVPGKGDLHCRETRAR